MERLTMLWHQIKRYSISFFLVACFFLCPLKKPIDRGEVVSENDETGNPEKPALENGDQPSYHSNNHENDPKCNSKCMFHDIIIV